MTSSQLVTLTARHIGSASSDGSFAAFVIPSINSAGLIGNGGLYISETTAGNTMAAGRAAWQNTAAVGVLLEEARVISCGLRLTPMVPGTSAPGGCFVSSLPTTSFDHINGQTKANLITSPLFTWGVASSGATVTSRPIDPNSYIFHHNNVIGLDSFMDSPVTVPAIIMNGLPAGSSVLCEAVLQVEGITGLAAQTQSVNSLQASNAPPSGLTRAFTSIESMWRTVSAYLPAPATVRTAVSLANRLLNDNTGSLEPPRLYRQQRLLN